MDLSTVALAGAAIGKPLIRGAGGRCWHIPVWHDMLTIWVVFRD